MNDRDVKQVRKTPVRIPRETDAIACYPTRCQGEKLGGRDNFTSIRLHTHSPLASRALW